METKASEHSLRYNTLLKPRKGKTDNEIDGNGFRKRKTSVEKLQSAIELVSDYMKGRYIEDDF